MPPRTHKVTIGDREFTVSRLRMGILREHGAALLALGGLREVSIPGAEHITALCEIVHGSIVGEKSSLDEFMVYIDSLDLEELPSIVRAFSMIFGDAGALSPGEAVGPQSSTLMNSAG